MDLGIAHYINSFNQVYTGNTASQVVQQTQLLNPGRWSNSDAASLLQVMINRVGNRQDLALADFFSLYAVTQKGPDGSRNALAARVAGSTNTNTILNALFGDGTQSNGLINGVLIGGKATLNQNTYPNIRYALTQLGFSGGNVPTGNTMPSVNNVKGHQNHFHIYLQPPKLEPIHATIENYHNG